MTLSGVKSSIRLFLRDLVMGLSNATIAADEYMAAYLFADTGYQYIWSKLDVHQSLLEDKVRVNAFEEAFKKLMGPGDRVLDVGTGSGILAFLAARTGAEVVGIDSANIVEVAEKTRQKNNIENVTFERCDIVDYEGGEYDFIICELIGVDITNEGIIHKMEKARRFLKPHGRVIPERLDVYVAPVESANAGLGFWRNLYGIDYSAIDSVKKEIRNYDMSGCRYLSKPNKALSIDLNKSSNSNLSYEGAYTLESDGQFHGCVMYFDAKLAEDVVLSTDPRKPLTHWKQVFLPHDRRVNVKAGEKLKVKVRPCYRNTRWRWSYEFI